MTEQDLKEILSTLNYGLNNCSDDNGDTETHFNSFANSIELVETELRKNKSCNKSCVPSDFYKGGKCDKNGCYY